MRDIPFFMTNKEWYEFDFKKRCFVLTDKATKEAKQSYKEYMEELNK